MNRRPVPSPCLSANALKLIAIAAMTLDHITWVVFPGFSRQPLALIFHILGRLTCPIMCFFIAEGYHHTRNFRAYARRLLLLSVLSHFAYIYGSTFAAGSYLDAYSFLPFYYGSALNQTSVALSLFAGLCMLRVNDSALSSGKKALAMALLCLLSFPCDWSCIAALCIFAIGTNRGEGKKQLFWCGFFVSCYVLVYCISLDVLYGLLQFSVFLSVPLLRLYNGQRGKSARLNRVMKPLFYFYYPLHLFLIGLVRRAL